MIPFCYLLPLEPEEELLEPDDDPLDLDDDPEEEPLDLNVPDDLLDRDPEDILLLPEELDLDGEE